VFFWRDAQGVEVDFVLWLNGRLQFIEAKWSETGGDSRALKSMHQIRSFLGAAAADRHLLACRTPAAHWHASDPSVRVVNAHIFRDWFNVPEPDVKAVREAGVDYTVKRRKKRPAKRKRTKQPNAGKNQGRVMAES
jgi:hypothetical protein